MSSWHTQKFSSDVDDDDDDDGGGSIENSVVEYHVIAEDQMMDVDEVRLYVLYMYVRCIY